MAVDIRKILMYFEEKFNSLYEKLESLNQSTKEYKVITKELSLKENIIIKPSTNENIIINNIILSSTFDSSSYCEVKINFGYSYIILVLTKQQPTLHITLNHGILLRDNIPATAKIESGCSFASLSLIYTIS